MAIADFTSFTQRLDDPAQAVPITVSAGSVSWRTMDTWMGHLPAPAAAPTTAVAPTSATAGAFSFQNSTTGTLGLVGARMALVIPGVYLLIDRLSQQGGLSGATTGAQTTNLPTAALTRYTSGAGVMMGATVWTQVGSTATTLTVTYTNSEGTTGRVSPTITFGSSSFREANRFLPLSLANGDVGVRSIQSATIEATTGTAGAFGLMLFKPLAAIIVDNLGASVTCDLVTGNIGGGMPEIVDDACLSVIATVNSAGGVNGSGSLFLSEW